MGAGVAGLAVAAVVGCGSSSTSGETSTTAARTAPVAHTVNASSATTPLLTRRQLLKRIDRLCAQESATTAPLLRQLNARGVRPNSAVLVEGLMAAARTLEFGLVRLHPAASSSDDFRRYRQAVTRNNTLFERSVAKQDPTHPPTQAEMDASDDSAILQQADAAILGARGCTFPPTRLEMHKRATG